MKTNKMIKIVWQLFRMSRPNQLAAITLVYGWGAIMANSLEYPVNLTKFGWGYAALIFVSISIHLANEYADYDTDRLTNRTMFSG
ncbi:MAG: prenyltransferase, partial [Chloroflexota bacterium]